jgi:hypothetical protein
MEAILKHLLQVMVFKGLRSERVGHLLWMGSPGFSVLALFQQHILA